MVKDSTQITLHCQQENAKNFADRIRPYFTGTGRKAALRDGFTGETIRLWLNGTYLPNQKSLNRIAEFIHKDVAWLLTGQEPVAQETIPAAPSDRDMLLRQIVGRLDEQGASIARLDTVLRAHIDRDVMRGKDLSARIDKLDHDFQEHVDKRRLQDMRDTLHRIGMQVIELQKEISGHDKYLEACEEAKEFLPLKKATGGGN